MLDLHEHIDIYCERTDFTFWSEPLNAITNGGFVVVALLTLLLILKHKPFPAQRECVLMMVLLVLIAIGSFLFHTLATRWAVLADVLPICVFVFCYLTFCLRHFWKASWLIVSVAVLSLLFASMLVPWIAEPGLLNGTVMYLPCMFLLFGMSIAAIAARVPHAHLLLTSSIFFVFSISFRAMDMDVCHQFAAGTHFLWHLSNAVVLYFMMRFFILASAHK